MKFALYYVVVTLIACLDQIVKALIINQFDLFERVTVLPGILDITHIRNNGAAYNLFSQMPILLIVMPSLVMFAGLVYIGVAHKKSNRLLMLAITMVIGGGLGNLIDRILKGYVVDYLDIHIIPIFNVADIFICFGCGLLFIFLIFIDGKQHEKP
jgi:signal peptidase II